MDGLGRRPRPAAPPLGTATSHPRRLVPAAAGPRAGRIVCPGDDGRRGNGHAPSGRPAAVGRRGAGRCRDPLPPSRCRGHDVVDAGVGVGRPRPPGLAPRRPRSRRVAEVGGVGVAGGPRASGREPRDDRGLAGTRRASARCDALRAGSGRQRLPSTHARCAAGSGPAPAPRTGARPPGGPTPAGERHPPRAERAAQRERGAGGDRAERGDGARGDRWSAVPGAGGRSIAAGRRAGRCARGRRHHARIARCARTSVRAGHRGGRGRGDGGRHRTVDGSDVDHARRGGVRPALRERCARIRHPARRARHASGQAPAVRHGGGA